MLIELFDTDQDGGYSVICDGKIASGLTVDEALAVVASRLFSGKPMFVKSYESELWFMKKYRKYDRSPVALLPLLAESVGKE